MSYVDYYRRWCQRVFKRGDQGYEGRSGIPGGGGGGSMIKED